jgi:quinohemoprotein amine dehydrogenase
VPSPQHSRAVAACGGVCCADSATLIAAHHTSQRGASGVQSFVRPLTSFLLLVGLVSLGAQPVAAQPPVVAPPQHPAATQPATPPAAATTEPSAQEPAADGQRPPEGDAADKPPRRGIPVDDVLVHTHCARCHALDKSQHMTRISFVRKSPEGWAETIKRMGRLHGLQLSPSDAKQLVRTLSNSHGLARSEAERGLYESERRVHWSEAHHDQDFLRACAQCHPLGRVLLQQRDDEEWQLLRATHVAMFPLARGQMGGGPPDEERNRFGGGGGGGGAPTGGGGAGGGARGGRGQAGRTGESPASGGDGGAPTQGVGDRVLAKLAKDQPLFTDAWSRWSKNKREVPLAGTWTVHGHETGRGDLVGTAELSRVDEDEYTIVWRLQATDGSTIERTGKGLLYAGYSWRGRSQDQAGVVSTWREVLLLDEAWQTLRGRMFTGNHDEIGADVTLVRDQGRPRVLAVGDGAIAVPSSGHRLTVHGEAFPPALLPRDFFVGAGITITAVERISDRRAVLVVDTAAGTELGPRTVAYGSDPGTTQVVLYDTVDYVRIRPLQGLARIGGAKHPKQIERYEAFAMHRGPDSKPYTEDDVDLFQVRPRWALAEFRVRENDDDLQFVGSIDAATGVFTPNVDGPNPARRWQANNIGDVFVTAEVELEVAVRPEPPKPKPPATGGAAEDKPADGQPAAAKPDAPGQAEAPTGPAPVVMEKKMFRARSHLIVTVPLYMRWAALDWEER